MDKGFNSFVPSSPDASKKNQKTGSCISLSSSHNVTTLRLSSRGDDALHTKSVKRLFSFRPLYALYFPIHHRSIIAMFRLTDLTPPRLSSSFYPPSLHYKINDKTPRFGSHGYVYLRREEARRLRRSAFSAFFSAIRLARIWEYSFCWAGQSNLLLIRA